LGADNTVMFNYTLAGSASQTIFVPSGNVIWQIISGGGIIVYEGNNANGAFFPLPKYGVAGTGTGDPLNMINMAAGTYTLKETSGEATTVCIWVYNVTGGY
jgi:hypothetical protein